MGKFSVGVINDNGKMLCDFSDTNGLAVTGTVFPHKEILKPTWKSPDGKTVNQIDHVLVNGHVRTSFLDTRVMTETEVYRDHQNETKVGKGAWEKESKGEV